MNIAIVLAAGKSKRMMGVDKIFYQIKGKPLLSYTINIFEKHPQIKKIILVVRQNNLKRISSLINISNFKKLAAVIGGGEKRQDSAFEGLKAAKKLRAKAGDLILFHNGANPLVSREEIYKVIKAAKKYKTALVGQMAKDTVKEIDKNGFLTKTLDRKKIFLAQTPQVIEYNLAKMAFKGSLKEKFNWTDDVSLVEKLGKRVKIVPCSYRNIKVTNQDDLKIIKTFL